MQTSNHLPEEPDRAKEGGEAQQPSQPFYEFPEEDLIRRGLVYPPPPSFYQQTQMDRSLPTPLSSVPPVPTNPGMESAGTFLPQLAGYVPPFAPAPPMQPPVKKSYRWIWITVSILVVLLLAGCGLCGWAFSQLVTPIVHSETDVITVVNNYYAALQESDYTGAYQYLMPQDSIQGMTQTTFTQRAQNEDKQYGTVRSYTIGMINVVMTSDASLNFSRFTVDVNVARARHSYNVVLTLQKSGNNWKIIDVDNI